MPDSSQIITARHFKMLKKAEACAKIIEIIEGWNETHGFGASKSIEPELAAKIYD